MLTCIFKLQWYVAAVTIPKLILLIIHSTNASMSLLMKLTSLLLVETLSDSDYIMVNISNTSCTDNVVPASSSQRNLIEHCIDTQFDVTPVGINLSTVCQEARR